MKGGILNRLRGKQISLIFSVLAGATIIFCAWERGPTVSTLLSAHDQFLMSTSAIFRVGPDRSTSKKSKEEKKEILSHPLITGEGKNDHTKQDIYAVPIGSPTMSTSTRTKNDGDLTTSSSVNQHTKKDVYAVPIGSPTMSTSTRTKNDSDLTTSSSVNQSTKKDIYAVPIGSPTMNTSARTKNDSDLTTSSSVNQDCNYAKGKWITDNRRPLYSGFGCKQWLSGMWACRLNQRPNFSYEGFRWQPKNCEMPEFNSSTFLRKMQDKTIAFIGDSLGRQQFQSLMCMVTDGEYTTEVENVGWQYGLVKARGAIRPDGWAYRFPRTNTTILYYWSATLCNLEPLNLTNPATEYALHLDRPATFLSHYLHRFDILVLNTGHHWNRGKFSANRWVMYVNGTPNSSEKLADFGNAKNFAVYNVVMWVDSQLSQHPKLQPFFRTISPRHFFNGDWNTGGTCDNTSPSGGSEVLKDESSDPVVEDAVKGRGVKILDITAISQLRDEAHISRYSIRPTEGMQDCLHWCLPGIPDTWNELLVAQI